MDIFRPRGEARALLMFIHGGYWRSLDKKDHSFVAAPFVKAGAAVAAINYSLCPAVKVEDIVMQCLKAGAWLYRNAAEVGAPAQPDFRRRPLGRRPSHRDVHGGAMAALFPGVARKSDAGRHVDQRHLRPGADLAHALDQCGHPPQRSRARSR